MEGVGVAPDGEVRPATNNMRLPLRRNPQFMLYWTAGVISGTGSAISAVVLPIFAVAALGASPGEMALLGMAELVPALVFALPTAMWADSISEHLRAITMSRIVAGVVAGLIPVAWWLDALTFELLLLLVALEALAGVFMLANTGPALVGIVPKDQLVDASGKLNGTRSATDIAGQALGGVLVSIASAPAALMVDAVSYIVGAAGTAAMEKQPQSTAPDEAEPEPRGRVVISRAAVREVTGIGGRLARRPALWTLMAVALVNGITETVFVLFAIRTLDVGPGTLALLLATGAVGGVIGGFVAGHVATRLDRWTVSFGVALTAFSLAPLGIVEDGVPVGIALINFEFAGALGGTIVIATVLGNIQAAAVDDGTVARSMAIAQNALQVAALVGLAIGAFLAEALGFRQALIVGTAVVAGVALPLALIHAWSSPRDANSGVEEPPANER